MESKNKQWPDIVILFLACRGGINAGKIAFVQVVEKLGEAKAIAKPILETEIRVRAKETPLGALTREAQLSLGNKFSEAFDFSKLMPFYFRQLTASGEMFNIFYFIGWADEAEFKKIKLPFSSDKIVWVSGSTRIGYPGGAGIDIVLEPGNINALKHLWNLKQSLKVLL